MAYAEQLDAGDFDGVTALFAAATFGREDELPRRGREEIRRMYDAVVVYPDGTPRTKHLITNVVVAIDPGRQTATSRCAFTVIQGVEPGLPIETILSGAYRDRFGRDGAAWRFTERVVVPMGFGDLSRHYRRA